MRSDLICVRISPTLHPKQQAALVHVIEEAGEMIHAATSILRFGKDAIDGATKIVYHNHTDLLQEYDDLQETMRRYLETV